MNKSLSCPWNKKNCNRIPVKNESKKNFYEDHIEINYPKKFKNLKLKYCLSCYCNLFDDWFNEKDSYKIYNNVYGQHHRGWKSLLNYLKKSKNSSAFKQLDSVINIKNLSSYAEFNCPLIGSFIEIEKIQTIKKLNKKFNLILKKNKLFSNADNQTNEIKKNLIEYKKTIIEIKKIKNKKKIKKYLFTDHSNLSWNDNCNFKNTNCKSLAVDLLDVEINNINYKSTSLKIDLFNFYHTLDHTWQPFKALLFALKNSKIVMITSHNGLFTSKQHLFSLTKNFGLFLKSKKIFYKQFTFESSNANEIYFLCSLKRKNLFDKKIIK